MIFKILMKILKQKNQEKTEIPARNKYWLVKTEIDFLNEDKKVLMV